MLLLAGCTSMGGNSAYCVDNNNKVVSQAKCNQDNGGGGFYYLVGPYGPNRAVGSTLDSTKAAYPRFSSSDTTSRTNAGLPKTGAITNGKTVSGGFGGGKSGSGKSGSGAGKSGGFGGGFGFGG